ncbi:PREDICTED: coiled-coil domain-containing protein 189-like [Amphimedon queenslandica]|uniref:Coiled-coil domain-containing protein 189 n=1 Tax=Amphimedon queenslandica TaxID=400682 RepID=A0A1X7VPN5_AMPQE|nr:PREDICTED: coiled-coil domain-containing protein 189-like [Amphimedon queenslandica]|eukprot:XP_011409536.1 PREDICTED: coiled-coil domain-containing protein 189-like [Amphimedon queenslandica]
MSTLFTPRICTWEDLDYTNAEKLLDAKTTNGTIYNHTGGLLYNLLGTEGEMRIKITTDLFYNLILFCRKNKFSPEQLTALFTILKTLHLLCISTPYNNIEECHQLMKDFIIKHSVFRPPYSICLFSLHQVKLTTEYLLETYFKHYKMYKYAFTKRVLLDLSISYDRDGEQKEAEVDPISSQEEAGKINTAKSEEEIEQKEQAETTEEEATIVEEPDEIPDDLKQLKDLISQTLTERLNEMKVTVEKELSKSDKRLTDRLNILEAETDGGKGGKKKK